MKKLTMADVRRAYEKIDRTVFIPGSSNWCQALARELNRTMATDTTREASPLGRGVVKLVDHPPKEV